MSSRFPEKRPYGSGWCSSSFPFLCETLETSLCMWERRRTTCFFSENEERPFKSVCPAQKVDKRKLKRRGDSRWESWTCFFICFLEKTFSRHKKSSSQISCWRNSLEKEPACLDIVLCRERVFGKKTLLHPFCCFAKYIAQEMSSWGPSVNNAFHREKFWSWREF